MASNQDSSTQNAGSDQRAEDETAPTPDSSAEINESDINFVAELRQARKDRLAQIKADVEAEAYDSDEILDAALERMFDRVIPDEKDETKDKP